MYRNVNFNLITYSAIMWLTVENFFLMNSKLVHLYPNLKILLKNLGSVAPVSIKFKCQLNLIAQISTINFNWRFRDFTCKFN